ncbi:MAG: hypothetical protein QM764_16095 [Chitinophagaceae bacterium]
MGSIAIKEALHNYIDTGDDRLLQMIYAIVREYNNSEISDEVLAEMENRTAKRKSGKSKTYKWNEAKAMITKSVGRK